MNSYYEFRIAKIVNFLSEGELFDCLQAKVEVLRIFTEIAPEREPDQEAAVFESLIN